MSCARSIALQQDPHNREKFLTKLQNLAHSRASSEKPLDVTEYSRQKKTYHSHNVPNGIPPVVSSMLAMPPPPVDPTFVQRPPPLIGPGSGAAAEPRGLAFCRANGQPFNCAFTLPLVSIAFSTAPPTHGGRQQPVNQQVRYGLFEPSYNSFDNFGQPMYASGTAPHNGFVEASVDGTELEDYTRMLDSAFNTLRRYVSYLLLFFTLIVSCVQGEWVSMSRMTGVPQQMPTQRALSMMRASYTMLLSCSEVRTHSFYDLQSMRSSIFRARRVSTVSSTSLATPYSMVYCTCPLFSKRDLNAE